MQKHYFDIIGSDEDFTIKMVTFSEDTDEERIIGSLWNRILDFFRNLRDFIIS